MKTNIYPHLIGMLLILCLSSCVQKRHPKTITFKVDMNGIEGISEVGIAGEFTATPWKEVLPLNDEDRDGIYEGTFSKETAYNGFEFKFVADGTYELEGKDNRAIVLEYKPETLVYEATFNNPNGQTKIID